MNPSNQEMFENHMAFLASHRGTLERNHANGTLGLQSDRPEFTYAILDGFYTGLRMADSTKTVQLLPWCPISEHELVRMGFAPAIGLSYMVFNGSVEKWNRLTELEICKADNRATMDTFSEVQSRGFSNSEEDYQQWHNWLNSANQRNLQNSSQNFFIGKLAEHAVGVTLTVMTPGLVGIYAVATLKEFRRRGIGTSIMRFAIENSEMTNQRNITLQVRQDSDTEKFYQKLGFDRVFTTTFFTTTKSRRIQ